MKVSRHRSPGLGPVVLGLLWLIAASGCAEAPFWKPLAGGLELGRLAAETESPSLTLVRSPSGARVRVRRDEDGLLVSELGAEPRVLAAVNANYFDGQGRALGWVVADGKTHSELGRAGWGVLSVDGEGRVSVRRPAAVAPDETVRQAVQAGPLLVEAGKANPGLKTQTARRVFVGLDAEGRLVLGSTGIARADAPTLAARLARPLAAGGAGLVDVLNLDGGSSAQLFVRGGHGEADLLEPGLVRVPVVLTLEASD